MKKKAAGYIKIFIKGWGYSLLVALILSTSIKSALADFNDIPTGSMEPTILKGDRLFINKLSYDLKIPYTTIHLMTWNNPDRGDIVVFYSPEDGKRLIKRVIGLPGDTISMKRNRIYINGKPLQYEITSVIPDDSDTQCLQPGSCFYFNEGLPNHEHLVKFIHKARSLNTFDQISVPEGYYMMLGDNRDNSADSRYFGFVDRKKILGKALYVVASRDKNFLSPRWSRFFTPLN